MINQFRIGEPIQTEIYSEVNGENEKLISKSRVIYQENSETSNLLKPISFKIAKGNSQLKTQIQYKYDDLGNVIQSNPTDGSPTTYIWSYNQMYPVAKIENATFSEVATALGMTEAALMDFDESSISTLDALRSHPDMVNTMITTYTYEPLVGIKTITDPRGNTMTYHYDEFNRLEFVKDKDGNLVSENKHNYKD